MLSLRKGSRKDICPRCRQRTFTPYVDETGQALADFVGRCDREEKCRYHVTPSEFYRMSRSLSDTMGHDRRKKIVTERPRIAPRPVAVPPDRIDVLEPTQMLRSLKRYEENPLARFLHSRFDDRIGPETVDHILRKLNVGTCTKYGGSTLFWLVDHLGKVRDGKIMGYDSTTGCRIKKPYAQVCTVNSMLGDRGIATPRPCMFGAHQAMFDTRLPIWVFESEKAAVITALAMEGICRSKGLFMAAGGCKGFNPTPEQKADPYSRINVLHNRRVVLFPDQGKFDEWAEKGRMLAGFCREVYVATSLERHLHPANHPVECEIGDGDGFDDLILRYLEAGYDKWKIADLIQWSHGATRDWKVV